MNEDKIGLVEVFTPYITRKGKKVYRKDGKKWHFWAPPQKKKESNRK